MDIYNLPSKLSKFLLSRLVKNGQLLSFPTQMSKCACHYSKMVLVLFMRPCQHVWYCSVFSSIIFTSTCHRTSSLSFFVHNYWIQKISAQPLCTLFWTRDWGAWMTTWSLTQNHKGLSTLSKCCKTVCIKLKYNYHSGRLSVLLHWENLSEFRTSSQSEYCPLLIRKYLPYTLHNVILESNRTK
jgi:hypothetical protein